MAKTAKQIVSEYDQGLSKRINYDTLCQELHDYFDNVGIDIINFTSPGTELNIHVLYDSNSLDSADTLASGLMNHLTPPASSWFNFRTSDPLKMDNKEVAVYLQEIGSLVQHRLNSSNFYNVMVDFYKKSGVYGTSTLYIEEDEEDGVRFYSLDFNSVVLIENSKGRVADHLTIWKFSAAQAIEKFGAENLHTNIIKASKKQGGDDTEFNFVLSVAPNPKRDIRKTDSKNKPYIAQWVDKDHMQVVMTSGYDESPFMSHRFYKRSNSAYGYSPAMKALSDVRLLNTKAKTLERANMKAVDPAWALPENAFLAPFNANPRATNYYKKGMLSKDDIIPLGGQGNYQIGMESLMYSISRVKSIMFTDVFLAFDGVTKQMNNPEVYEKIAEKMTMLGPAVGRFISEILDPLLTRMVSLMFRQGMLPEPPQELLDNPSIEIEYVSKLAMAQKNGEMQALQNALMLSGNLAEFNPEVLDKIEFDLAVDAIWGITGAPTQILRDDVQVGEFRAARAEAQAQAERAEAQAQGADVALKASQIEKNMKEIA